MALGNGGPPRKPESPDPEVNLQRAKNREHQRRSRAGLTNIVTPVVVGLGQVIVDIPKVRVIKKTSHVPSVGPGPGEMRVGAVPELSAGLKVARDFLFPPMPGAFQPSVIRKLPVEKLRARYLKVLGATMGNHSISLFYCAWSQDQFEEALNAKFRKAILNAKAQLADRASFIMHKSMGLIADGDEIGAVNAQVSSALAKVVENFKAKDVDQESGGGFKLIVEGLDRSAQSPVPPGPVPPPGAVKP